MGTAANHPATVTIILPIAVLVSPLSTILPIGSPKIMGAKQTAYAIQNAALPKRANSAPIKEPKISRINGINAARYHGKDSKIPKIGESLQNSHSPSIKIPANAATHKTVKSENIYCATR